MKQFALLALLGFASAVRQEAVAEPDYTDSVDQATLDSLQSIDLSAFDFEEPAATT